jgi:hypothetical protein
VPQPATTQGPLESLLGDARDSVSNTLSHWGDVGSGMLTSIGNQYAYGNDNGASTSPGAELAATAATGVLGDVAARGTRIGRRLLSPLTGETNDQIEAGGEAARDALTYKPRLPQTNQFLQDAAPYVQGAGKVASAITPDWVKSTVSALKSKWQDAAKDIPLATDVLGTAAMYNPESVLGVAGEAASAAGKGAGWVAKNAEHFPYDLGLNPKMYVVPPGEGAALPAKAAAPLHEVTGDADAFHAAISDAAEAHPNGSSVTVYPKKDYANMRLFMTPNKDAGYALKGDDIVSVFKSPDAPYKNFGQAALAHAVENGGRRLDAFDTALPSIYSKAGFKTVARTPFSDEYAPQGWDYNAYSQYNGGRPDVLYMVHDPENAVPLKGAPPAYGQDPAHEALRQSQMSTFEHAPLQQTMELNKIERDKAFSPALKSAIAANPEMSSTADFLHENLSPEEFARFNSEWATDPDHNWLAQAHDLAQQSMTGQITNPDEIAAMAHAGLAKMHWYTNSANALKHVFGSDSPRFGALLAAMSPQTSVQSNLRNALNTWKNWVAEGRPQDEQHILDIMGRSVEGNKGIDSVLPGWMNNSVDALTHPDPANLQLSGPKVNEFAGALRNELNRVVNDAWMATGSRMDQSLYGGSGNGIRDVDRMRPTGKVYKKTGEPMADPVGGMGPGYMYQSAMTRKAAKTLTAETGVNWEPSHVQETMWSYVKPLVEFRRKGMANGADLNQLHSLLDEHDIAGTPDFSTLLRDTPEYANVLRESGYGPQLDTMHTVPHLDVPVTKQSFNGQTYRPDDLRSALSAIDKNETPDKAFKSTTQNAAFDRWNKSTGIPAAAPMYRKPIPVVHATGADFKTPDMSRTDWGIHVGPPSASNARVELPASDSIDSSYAPNSQPLYINTKNPVRMTDSNGAWQTDRMANDLVKRGTLTPEEAKYVQSAYTPVGTSPLSDQEALAKQRLIELLKKKGHDAIVYQNRFEGIPDEEWSKYFGSRKVASGIAGDSTVADMARARTETRRNLTDEEFKAAFPSVQDSYLMWDPGMVKGRFNRGTWDPKDPNRMKAKGGLIRKYADGGPVVSGQLPDVTVTAPPPQPDVPAPMPGMPVTPDPKYGTKVVMMFGRPVTVSADPRVGPRAEAAMQRLTQQDLVDAIRRQKGLSVPASQYGRMTARRASPAWLQQAGPGSP